MRLSRIAALPLVAALIVTPVRSEDPKPPEGARALFNGKDLSGWKATGKAEVWGAEKGVIFVDKGGGGWLLTEEDFGDFELWADYKMSKGANSGVALRTPREG